MNPKFEELKTRLMEANDINSAASVLNWDQLTHMPVGGTQARARHLATLSRLAHDRLTDPELGKLLDELRSLDWVSLLFGRCDTISRYLRLLY